MPWPRLAPTAPVSSYRVVYERERPGVWVVEAPDVQGCHTWGRSLEQSRRHIREALSLCVDDAAFATLDEEIHTPRAVRDTVTGAREARAKAEALQARALLRTEAAVRRLTGEFGFSLRDAGELLGLSRQRAHQLTARGKAARKG